MRIEDNRFKALMDTLEQTQHTIKRQLLSKDHSSVESLPRSKLELR